MNYAQIISKYNRLRWLCRALAASTGGVSLWSNALHAFHNGVIAIIISMVAPSMVMASFELGSRIPIDPRRSWYIRVMRPAATTVICGIGAWLSYFHQRDAFARYLHDPKDTTPALLPVSIDGLMVMAAVSLFELNRRLEELENKIQMDKLKQESRARVADPIQVGGRGKSKREAVLDLLQRVPDMSVDQIASITGASQGYVNNLVSELRKANGAELVAS